MNTYILVCIYIYIYINAYVYIRRDMGGTGNMIKMMMMKERMIIRTMIVILLHLKRN
jgi:hypothetical protein